jgi:hypothetical protein
MEVSQWFAANWFDALSAIGIAGSLLFAGFNIRSEARTRRIANLIALTESHRDIWKELFRQPRIGRVLDASADVTKEAVSQEEDIFVNLIIQHLGVVFGAMRDDLTIKPEGLRRDIAWFFSLPVPADVWKKTMTLQDREFIEFVEASRKMGNQSFQG